jgi:hypothetical protein
MQRYIGRMQRHTDNHRRPSLMGHNRYDSHR